MPETTPLIKAALNLRVGAGFDVYVSSYIQSKKIETAQNMLCHSDYAISVISTTLAFPSQSYFTSVFREKTGTTPTQYRAEHFRTSGIK